jgi:hypothetical protein
MCCVGFSSQFCQRHGLALAVDSTVHHGASQRGIEPLSRRMAHRPQSTDQTLGRLLFIESVDCTVCLQIAVDGNKYMGPKPTKQPPYKFKTLLWLRLVCEIKFFGCHIGYVGGCWERFSDTNKKTNYRTCQETVRRI